MNTPDISTSDQRAEASGLLILLGISAVAHISGLIVTGFVIKSGLSVVTQSGFNHRVAGAVALSVGAAGFYKIFKNAGSEIAALRQLTNPEFLKDMEAQSERITARSKCMDAHLAQIKTPSI